MIFTQEELNDLKENYPYIYKAITGELIKNLKRAINLNQEEL